MHEGVSPGVQSDVDELLFERTRWDLIQLVAGENAAEYEQRQAARALNQLCEIYRTPILAYFTRATASPHDAEDLTQDFLSRRTGPELFANTAADRGRFRAWLLVSLKNFWRDRTDRDRAVKRGGNVEFVPLQEGVASSGGSVASDDVWFDACWAKALVDRSR
jgi:RNA polymerase sigma-70 factor (ECF subfamily)